MLETSIYCNCEHRRREAPNDDEKFFDFTGPSIIFNQKLISTIHIDWTNSTGNSVMYSETKPPVGTMQQIRHPRYDSQEEACHVEPATR